MNANTFLIIQSIIYGILGVTNLLFTKHRLRYVFDENYQVTALDIFWQRDIGIFQVGLAIVALYSTSEPPSAMKVALLSIGFVWGLGALLMARTALFDSDLQHVVSRNAGLGLALITGILAILNLFFWTTLA